MHHSKLDFIFSDVTHRFSDSQFIHMDPVYFFTLHKNDNNKNQTLRQVGNDLKNKQHAQFRHLTPKITLELFNYIISLVLFMLRYSATFWHLSKLYSLVFSIHLFLFSCVSVLSLSIFDVLFKYETVFVLLSK